MDKKMVYKNTAAVYVLRAMELAMQLMVFSIIFILLYMGFFCRTDVGAVSCMAIISVPTVLLYIVRGWCPNRAVNVIAHAGALLYGFFVVQDEAGRVAYFIAAAIMIIYSVSLILDSRNHFGEKMSAGMLVLFVGAMLAGGMTGTEVISRWAQYLGAAFMIVQVLYHNLNNLNDIMTINHGISNFPAGQMTKVNLFIMLTLCTVCAGAMLIINNTYVYRMLYALKKLVLELLRRFFGLFDIGGGAPEFETSSQEQAAPSEGFPGAMESGLLQDILNGIAMLLGIVVLIAAVIFLAAAAFRMMKRMKGRDGVQGDVREFLAPEEIRGSLRRKRRGEDHGDGAAVGIKVRRLYRQMVLKNAGRKKAAVDKSLTPCEISRKYIPDCADEATVIYEKARYGNEEISQQELERLRKIKKIQKSI